LIVAEGICKYLLLIARPSVLQSKSECLILLGFTVVRCSVNRFLPVIVGFIAVFSFAWCAGDDEKTKLGKPESDLGSQASREAIQEALAVFNPLIGGWRGVGQPVRGSNKGSWTERAEWVWELKKERVGIRYVVKNGKQLSGALLTWDPRQKEFELVATLPDQSERVYRGTHSGNKLTLQSAPGESGDVHQIVVTQLSEIRTLVLFQARSKGQQQFARVAEVGYTREGTTLAEEGVVGPECIVTGGKGTMKTVYKGKTYWFCCTGCREAFNDDPDTIIAQAEEKAAKKKAEKGKKAEKAKS
jgi:YHS domain-containing protein